MLREVRDIITNGLSIDSRKTPKQLALESARLVTMHPYYHTLKDIYILAHTYSYFEEWENAVKTYQEYFAKKDEEPLYKREKLPYQSLYNAAISNMVVGNYQHALDLFLELKAHPEHSLDITSTLGLLYFNLEQKHEAVKIYQELARKENPNRLSKSGNLL